MHSNQFYKITFQLAPIISFNDITIKVFLIVLLYCYCMEKGVTGRGLRFFEYFIVLHAVNSRCRQSCN